MNIQKIEEILKKFASNTIGFQGVALVNLNGQPISIIGVDKNTASIMASTMIYLAERTHKEVGWEAVEQIDVKSTEGYFILTTCSPDVFLLVKASKVPEGMLLVDINRTVEKLKAALKEEDFNNSDSHDGEPQNTELTNTASSDTKTASSNNHLPHPQMYRGSQVLG
ncbi:MAG: roadblock/LC7 domain-containing protein [Scytonema sp. PMC 1069.18]|nr:roadblock/LC7 domain-containing protein [Scytonema sp. PMC 1069.18]MEC4883481.1 roadblock/LC7 domain-containing protein [Scytonema sp. PMC 1070.18]